MYYYGYFVDQNYEEAFKWYKLAADQKDAKAQFVMGTMYFFGDHVDQDYEEAFNWYSCASDQGNLDAHLMRGLMYCYGYHVNQNYAEGLEWINRAAENGHSESQFIMGQMYYDGFGVDRDYAAAFEWFSLAAGQGDEDAKCALGIMYENGEGVEASLSKAIEFYREACQDNSSVSEEAAYRLGYIYYDGRGVKQDKQKALEYFLLAYENGYECSYAVDMLRNELGIDNKQSRGAMHDYAVKVSSKKISLPTLYSRVEKDLKKDFGDLWESIQQKTQVFLSTSMVSYLALYAMGDKVRKHIDFTSAITPMIKAFEGELAKYFYTGYIKYLIENDVSPVVFTNKKIFIVPEGAYGLKYSDPEDIKEFSLGKLPHIIGIREQTQSVATSVGFIDENDRLRVQPEPTVQKSVKKMIDAPMLEYAKTIFREDAFGDVDIDRAITDYLFDLATEMKTITDSFRNPAAHSDVMSYKRAETCADYLFKDKKILCKFIEKIKPEISER